jgi:hypothetical protein
MWVYLKIGLPKIRCFIIMPVVKTAILGVQTPRKPRIAGYIKLYIYI